MQIAVLTFDGFNELDSFVPAAILNRMRSSGWAAYITSPDARITSMNGVTIDRQRPLEFANEADAVIIGSGLRTREVVEDRALMSAIALDPSRQLIGAQCSGTLILSRLGLIGGLPACTDLTTRPWVVAAGVDVIDAPFIAHGNVATAGGCMATQYLACWVIAKLATLKDAAEAMHYVAPVGEKDTYVERTLSVVRPYLAEARSQAA